MLEGKRPTALNINAIKNDSSPVTSTHRDHSPTITMRRRRTKIQKSSKTNEELIIESFQNLLAYVDSVDGQVKGIVDSHEAEYALAYRKHSEKVREEMKQIKQRISENVESEKRYLEKIGFLEKQLTIFREDMLKMSEKLIAKQEEIQRLKANISELTGENRQQKSTIVDLFKRNKDLSVSAAREHEDSQVCGSGRGTAPRYDWQMSNLGEFTNPYRTEERKNFSIRFSHTSQLRNRARKEANPGAKVISSTIQQNSNEQNARNLVARLQIEGSVKTNTTNQLRKSSRFRASLQKKKLLSNQLTRAKIKSLAERSEYQQIFINCVKQAKRAIVKRDFACSLNHFKENGTLNLAQFKRLDYLSLLQLFLRSEPTISKIYQLTFTPPRRQ